MKSILVIDDDHYMRELLADLLTSEGYEVSTAGDGEIGLRLFARIKPDLVILDTIMPGVEGVETLRCISHVDPYVPVIAISSGGKLGIRACLETMVAFGARAGLPKPIHIPGLLETVRSLVESDTESMHKILNDTAENDRDWATLEPLKTSHRPGIQMGQAQRVAGPLRSPARPHSVGSSPGVGKAANHEAQEFVAPVAPHYARY